MTTRNLDEAVARALGWRVIQVPFDRMIPSQTYPEWVDANGLPWERSGWLNGDPPPYSTDNGLAFALLLGQPHIRIDLIGDMVQVSDRSSSAGVLLASGPTEKCAAILCEAWLKVKGIEHE